MQVRDIQIGKTVYWIDPEGSCSGFFIVREKHGNVIVLTNEAGSELEAFARELRVKMYRLRSRREYDDETGESLYWNKDDGWVDRDSATLFESEESCDTPIGPYEIMCIPTDEAR